MDIYPSVAEYLLAFPIFNSWNEMGTILQRAASRRPRDWQLPIITCQAVGESPENAIPACAALACSQISIILVDDMLDDDPRGEYHRIGNGRAANFAIAFEAASVDSILESSASTNVRKEAVKSLNRMMRTTAFGQDLDVQNPSDESFYWRVVENKSAPFYGCAFHLGALFGNAGVEAENELERLGRIYGAMIQIHDDLNDTMAVPANPDWILGRKPLPILFALTVDHPRRAKFTELFQNISADHALQEAQEILIQCGAVSYCVDQLLRRHQAAQEILRNLKVSNRESLDLLIDEIVAPVQRLFESLGTPLNVTGLFQNV